MSLDPALSNVSLFQSHGPEGLWPYDDLVLPSKSHMTPAAGARQTPSIAMTG